MPTQNVNLTKDLDTFVKDQVKTGFYNNASEVHRAALSCLAKEKEHYELKLKKLRHEIDLAYDDLHAGRTHSYDNAGDLLADIIGS